MYDGVAWAPCRVVVYLYLYIHLGEMGVKIVELSVQYKNTMEGVYLAVNQLIAVNVDWSMANVSKFVVYNCVRKKSCICKTV